MTAQLQPTTFLAVPFRVQLQRPAHSPSCLFSGTETWAHVLPAQGLNQLLCSRAGCSPLPGCTAAPHPAGVGTAAAAAAAAAAPSAASTEARCMAAAQGSCPTDVNWPEAAACHRFPMLCPADVITERLRENMS